MAFLKTLWADRQVPKIDAAQLNRIEQGIADAHVPEAWHVVGAAGEPAFQNGWVNLDAASYYGAQFRKLANGNVEIRGIVKSGVHQQAIFTLPVGYRPTRILIFATDNNGAFGRLDVSPTGVVLPWVGVAATPYLSLDVVRFAAEA